VVLVGVVVEIMHPMIILLLLLPKNHHQALPMDKINTL
jgi:hypothetical protein